MKYYKLTCIKDLPDVDIGYSCSFAETDLGNYFYFDEDMDKKNCLLRYYNDNRFIKMELDTDRAIPNLICPKCNKKSLFPKEADEYSEYQGDGVTYWYKEVFIECGYDDCDYQQKISKVLIRTKVEW